MLDDVMMSTQLVSLFHRLTKCSITSVSRQRDRPACRHPNDKSLFLTFSRDHQLQPSPLDTWEERKLPLRDTFIYEAKIISMFRR